MLLEIMEIFPVYFFILLCAKISQTETSLFLAVWFHYVQLLESGRMLRMFVLLFKFFKLINLFICVWGGGVGLNR